MKGELIKIGISIGELGGIGLEVFINALEHWSIPQDVALQLYAPTAALQAYCGALGLSLPLHSQSLEPGVPTQGGILNIIELKGPTGDELQITPGKPTLYSGALALASLKSLVTESMTGALDGMLTLPIDKANIGKAGFQFPGHTEYLAKAFGKSVLMLMVSKKLRVGVLTGHIPLKKVAGCLTPRELTAMLKILINTLQDDFGIAHPRVAVLGLNPHAGEEGLIGFEERDIISPNLEWHRNAGWEVKGPFPADGFFGSGAHSEYDGVLAMYHDQGLIPFKVLAFGGGTNYTAGLPVPRISPDHGTAYSLVGTGKATHTSTVEALDTLLSIVKVRSKQKSTAQ